MSKNRRGSHQPTVNPNEFVFVVIPNPWRHRKILFVRYEGETRCTLPGDSHELRCAGHSPDLIEHVLETQFPEAVFETPRQDRHYYGLNDAGETCSVKIFITSIREGRIKPSGNSSPLITEHDWLSFTFAEDLITAKDGLPSAVNPLLSILIAKPPQLPVK